MRSFFDRPWWTALSVLVMAAWLAFLVVGTRTKQSYLLAVAPEMPKGGHADWRNKDGTLILTGWSLPEETFRWSDSATPGLCLKPKPAGNGATGEATYSVGLDLSTIEGLVGKDVAVIIDGTRTARKLRMEADWAWYWIDIAYPVAPPIICVSLELPMTWQPSFRDSRHLGIRLRGIELK